ncbi:MAG TPA: hypothetical protein DEA44_15280 [Firmicutes bacterium]|nr:hypothetical protein [Bacillota bacterium]
MVLNAVQEKLNEAVHVQGVGKIKAGMEKLLSDVKVEYTLSKLIEEMKEKANEYGDKNGEEISFHINPDRHILTHIYFDEDGDKEQWQCKYRLCVSEDGTIFSAEIRDKKFDNRVIMGGLRGFEETMFKLFASGGKIVIDENNVDIEYGYSEED